MCVDTVQLKSKKEFCALFCSTLHSDKKYLRSLVAFFIFIFVLSNLEIVDDNIIEKPTSGYFVSLQQAIQYWPDSTITKGTRLLHKLY